MDAVVFKTVKIFTRENIYTGACRRGLMRTYSDIGWKTARKEACSSLAATFTFLAVYRYSFARTIELYKHWNDMLGAIFEAKFIDVQCQFLSIVFDGAVYNILLEVYRNFAF